MGTPLMRGPQASCCWSCCASPHACSAIIQLLLWPLRMLWPLLLLLLLARTLPQVPLVCMAAPSCRRSRHSPAPRGAREQVSLQETGQGPPGLLVSRHPPLLPPLAAGRASSSSTMTARKAQARRRPRPLLRLGHSPFLRHGCEASCRPALVKAASLAALLLRGPVKQLAPTLATTPSSMARRR